EAMSLRRVMAFPDELKMTSEYAFTELEKLTTDQNADQDKKTVRIFFKNGYQTDLVEAEISKKQCLQFNLGIKVDLRVNFHRSKLGRTSDEQVLQQLTAEAEGFAAPYVDEEVDVESLSQRQRKNSSNTVGTSVATDAMQMD
ncbi:UNVERIFIED_CONTAM: hypothetical protein HDU68_006108, partial [Siphonaria sp. JEL0065]